MHFPKRSISDAQFDAQAERIRRRRHKNPIRESRRQAEISRMLHGKRRRVHKIRKQDEDRRLEVLRRLSMEVE